MIKNSKVQQKNLKRRQLNSNVKFTCLSKETKFDIKILNFNIYKMFLLMIIKNNFKNKCSVCGSD